LKIRIVSKLLKALKRATIRTHNPLVLGSSPSGPINKMDSLFYPLSSFHYFKYGVFPTGESASRTSPLAALKTERETLASLGFH
jgi:hypothetical protein